MDINLINYKFYSYKYIIYEENSSEEDSEIKIKVIKRIKKN